MIIKSILIGLGALLAVLLLAFIVLAMKSQHQPDSIGLVNGKLRPCPDSPNCVCSETDESPDALKVIAPVLADAQTWQLLSTVIEANGGIIQQNHKDNYLHATFSSPIFHFVDDVEFRLDSDSRLIHMRSASRVGHSDCGLNRKRLDRLVQALTK